MPHKHRSKSILNTWKIIFDSQVGWHCELYIAVYHIISHIRRMSTSAEGIISMFIKSLHFIPPGLILKVCRSQVIVIRQYGNTSSTIIRNRSCMHFSNSYQEVLKADMAQELILWFLWSMCLPASKGSFMLVNNQLLLNG